MSLSITFIFIFFFAVLFSSIKLLVFVNIITCTLLLIISSIAYLPISNLSGKRKYSSKYGIIVEFILLFELSLINSVN
jgi:hypothetical protein